MQNDWTNKLWWAVPATAVLLLLILGSIFGKPPSPPGKGTSYDAGRDGFRAAYLLLEELGYPVSRSRRVSGGAVRLVFYPSKNDDEARSLGDWVRDGGILVLADSSTEFAGKLGLKPQVRIIEPLSEEQATGGGVARIAGGTVFAEIADPNSRSWASAGDKPLVTIHPHGRGAIWLVNRPEVLKNNLLAQADNSLLLCRMVEQILRERQGDVAFDEYFHGLRDRPGVSELLFQPPALWISIQALALLALLLWHYAPRFGAPRPLPSPTRRSKEEFLDALAGLLERKGDFDNAFRSARDALKHEFEHDLGLPGGTQSRTVAEEAARRRGMDVASLQRLLSANGPPDGHKRGAFVTAMNSLEKARDEFFHRRHPR